VTIPALHDDFVGQAILPAAAFQAALSLWRESSHAVNSAQIVGPIPFHPLSAQPEKPARSRQSNLRHAAFLCQLLLAATIAAAQPGATVQGRVISSAHGEAVANALVTLRGMEASSGPPQTYICQTGADGRFTIAGMAPGVYEPVPAKQGFIARPTERFATAHDFPPVTVESGATVTGLELRLIPESVIAGRVLDADGDPVRHAQVEAQQYAYVSGSRQLRSMHQVQTDDRGEYRMFNLPPGRYYVHAEATPRSFRRMFQPNLQVRGALPPATLAAAYYPGVSEPSRATELQAQPGGELDGIDISLAPEKSYAIRGKFPAGDSAKARRGVRVVDRSGNMARFQMMTLAGRDGYEVRDIAPGSYMVIGDSIDPANPEERLFARQPVDVIDRDVDGVDLTFSPGVKVKGTVKLEGSAALPLGDLTLVLQSSDLSGQQQAKIAADGTFSSPEMAPGIYQVRIGGRNVYLKSLRLGDRELPEHKIDTEHMSGDLTVAVSADFGQVEGTVTDEAGKPVYNANVTLISDQSHPDWPERLENGFTLPSGKFNFANVPPGEYKAYAWLGVEPGAPQSAEFRKPYEDRAVPVTVKANSRQAVDLKPIVVVPQQ
jgi:hypothetical protein